MNIPSLDFHLGETIEALRDTVQAFAAKEIVPRAAAVDRDNLFPADLWKKLGDLGLHGMTAPEEYGGSNMGYLAHIIALEEVSRASASVGLSYGAHSNLCINQIAFLSNQLPQQRDRLRAIRRRQRFRKQRPRLRQPQLRRQGIRRELTRCGNAFEQSIHQRKVRCNARRLHRRVLRIQVVRSKVRTLSPSIFRLGIINRA